MKNSVLIDNWSLQQVANIILYNDYLEVNEGNFNQIVNVLNNFFIAIIFFDDIIFIKNDYSTPDLYQFIDSRFNEQLRSLVIDNHIMLKCKEIAENGTELFKPSSAYDDVVIKGALEYYQIGKEMDINCLMHYDRSAFLKEILYKENKSNVILNYIEKEIAKYLEEFNNRTNSALVDTSIPVMINYILNEADNIETMLDVAYQIRESKECYSVRKWLNEINENLIKGNLLKCFEAVSLIDEIMKEFSDSLGKKYKEIEVGLSLSMPPSISKDFNISKINNSKEKHVVFLTDFININMLQRINSKRLIEVLRGK